MSMPFSTIRCNSCSKNWVTHDFWGRHSYRLSDGRDASAHRALAWCNACNDFVWMERLPEPEEVQEKLTEAVRDLEEALAPKEYLLFGFIKRRKKPNLEFIKIYQNSLRKAEALRDWRGLRRSSPKCLTCGSTEVQEANLWGDQEKEALRHPNCGGELRVEESEVRISKLLKHRFYDVEGNFLWEEEDRQYHSKQIEID